MGSRGFEAPAITNALPSGIKVPGVNEWVRPNILSPSAPGAPGLAERYFTGEVSGDANQDT